MRWMLSRSRSPYEGDPERINQQKGTLISGEYLNTNSRFKLQCSIGHQWVTTAGCIKKGSWCHVCSGHSTDKSYHESVINEIVALNNEEWVDGKYISSSCILKFNCELDHPFNKMVSRLKRGEWCSICSGHTQDVGYHIQRLEKLIEEKGGEWIYGEYIRSNVKIGILCQHGHTFEITPNALGNKQWCKYCSRFRSEGRCRQLIEEMTLGDWPKTKMPEFVIPETGGTLELDGYCEGLACAFEFQDQQHYEFNSFFHDSQEDFEWQQYRDELKRYYCREHFIELLEIPYTDATDQQKYDRIANFFDGLGWDYNRIEQYEAGSV